MRRARELALLDLTAGARALEVRRTELRSIERGRRMPDVAVLERAVLVYGADELVLPPRQDLDHPTDPTLLVVGEETIRVDPGRAGNQQVLVDYVAAVRRQRRVGPGATVPLRSHDLVQLAGVLDLAATDLEAQLAEVSSLQPEPARRSARRLVLTGLCLATAEAPSPRSERSGGSRPSREHREVSGRRPSARFDEIERLMAEFRSGT